MSSKKTGSGFSLERFADVATILAGASAVVITGLVLWRGGVTPSPDETASAHIVVENWDSYSAGGQSRGPAGAPITIVEFGDYQCRYCREAEPHLAAIQRKYSTSIAFFYRHLPLVAESVSYTAARAAECAGEQGVFWQFHERLFSSRDWQTEDPKDVFIRIGADVGVEDDVAFRSCVQSTLPVPAITEDLEAAEQLGVPGTPAFLVNDRLFMGVLDSLAFDVTAREILRQ